MRKKMMKLFYELNAIYYSHFQYGFRFSENRHLDYYDRGYRYFVLYANTGSIKLKAKTQAEMIDLLSDEIDYMNTFFASLN